MTCLACFLLMRHFLASDHAEAVTSSVNDDEDS